MNIPKIFDIPEFRQALNEFAKMRIKIRKPLESQKALTRLMNRLRLLAVDDVNLAIQLLQRSTKEKWQDVWPLKDYPKTPPKEGMKLNNKTGLENGHIWTKEELEQHWQKVKEAIKNTPKNEDLQF